MNSEFPPIAAPDDSQISPLPLAPTPHHPNSVARWRWWIALILMSLLPLGVALSAWRRGASKDSASGALLPANVPDLLVFCALQLGVFAVLWAIFWAFSRANRDQLFLRFRGGKSLLWGVAYSVLMRLALAFAAMFVLFLLTLLGFDLQKMMETLQSGGETLKQAFAPALASRDPLYRFLLITLISFVVAGLREELWRAATMAGIFHLAPKTWSQARKNAVALGVSSALFGIAHFYQGATGVLGTTLLGLVLGAIMLRHASVWPAVVAHGCFNAASFAALAAIGTGK